MKKKIPCGSATRPFAFRRSIPGRTRETAFPAPWSRTEPTRRQVPPVSTRAARSPAGRQNSRNRRALRSAATPPPQFLFCLPSTYARWGFLRVDFAREVPARIVAGQEGLEPPTFGFGDRRSAN